jgi:hypothetical protein
MSLRQFSANYDAVEDRILLRVTLTDGGEVRFWLTRASLRGFFGQVNVWLQPADSSPTAAVKSFQREVSAAQADLKTPLKPGQDFPFGEAPLLVKSISIKTTEAGVKMRFVLVGRQADFGITEEILAGVQALLRQVVAATDWGLAVHPAQPGGTTSTRLH